MVEICSICRPMTSTVFGERGAGGGMHIKYRHILSSWNIIGWMIVLNSTKRQSYRCISCFVHYTLFD